MTKNVGGRPTKTNMTCKEIVDIIKCGKEHDVEMLTFGDLSVKYHARSDVTPEVPLEAGQQLTEKTEAITLEEEIAQKEIELSAMAVEDPEAYEELLASGELTEGEDATENESK